MWMRVKVKWLSELYIRDVLEMQYLVTDLVPVKSKLTSTNCTIGESTSSSQGTGGLHVIV